MKGCLRSTYFERNRERTKIGNLGDGPVTRGPDSRTRVPSIRSFELIRTPAAARSISGAGRMRVYALVALLMLSAMPSAAAAWDPERSIEIVAPTGPAGGNDKAARTDPEGAVDRSGGV